jgi:hypothetical protein
VQLVGGCFTDRLNVVQPSVDRFDLGALRDTTLASLD